MILTKTEESRLLDSMAMKEYGIPEWCSWRMQDHRWSV